MRNSDGRAMKHMRTNVGVANRLIASLHRTMHCALRRTKHAELNALKFQSIHHLEPGHWLRRPRTAGTGVWNHRINTAQALPTHVVVAGTRYQKRSLDAFNFTKGYRDRRVRSHLTCVPTHGRRRRRYEFQVNGCPCLPRDPASEEFIRVSRLGRTSCSARTGAASGTHTLMTRALRFLRFLSRRTHRCGVSICR